MWKLALCAGLLGGTPVLASAAEALATVTLTDGSGLLLLREATRSTLSEGVRLHKDDIVQTSAQARLLRLEFADGTLLDLGPDTRVLLAPKLASERSKTSPRFYLLGGWVKLTAATSTAPNTPTANTSNTAFTAPVLDVSSVARQLVVAVLPNETYAFAESGPVTLAERLNTRAQPAITLKADQFYARLADAKATLTARPSAAFMQQVPRAFLDPLPSRAAAFKNREVPPKAPSELSYPEAQPWIDAEPALRPVMVARWRTLAQQPEFRKGLVATLKQHPEWERVLFPEKFAVKPNPKPNTPPADYSPR